MTATCRYWYFKMTVLIIIRSGSNNICTVVNARYNLCRYIKFHEPHVLSPGRIQKCRSGLLSRFRTELIQCSNVRASNNVFLLLVGRVPFVAIMTPLPIHAIETRQRANL